MNRKTKIAGLVAAIALPATALAGSIAQAQSHHAPPVTRTAPAHGNGSGSGQGGSATGGHVATEDQTGPDTDNVQEGDQTGSDGAASQAVTGEQAGSESGGPSDGPGGHEDPAGNVDHQFDGEE